MIKTTRATGFTLLEVVVAIAIVALTFAGATSVARGSIQSTERIETRLLAHWAASNIAVEIELMDELPHEPLTYSEVLVGRTFDVSAEIIEASDDARYVNIGVSLDGDIVLTRRHFLTAKQLTAE